MIKLTQLNLIIINSKSIWRDSKVVMHWIANPVSPVRFWIASPIFNTLHKTSPLCMSQKVGRITLR